ncbi:MAG: tRNA uridine-5-carboxymethylaminomethyl(34) synthesis GTPase MnmE, partial [Acidobacteria bacterium RIFCSPLOWO2_02_FULL_59_13]
LIELRMLVEATLDFPEEDIDAVDRQAARKRLARLRTDLADALAKGQQGSVLRTGLQVVLAGQPNVGKSSLLNRLAGEELAIVTSIPGTTRDAVRQTIQIDGVPLNIIDTAGLRDTRDEVEAIGIARTWQAIERADVLLLVVDAASGVTVRDREIIARLPQRLPHVVVFNKIDLKAEPARAIASAQPGGETHLWLSARTGEGLDLLRGALLSIAGWRATGEDLFLARERHIVALARASQCLERAEAMLDQAELFAEELRLAQHELGTITGEYSADDLLGEIFSRFCIGK